MGNKRISVLFLLVILAAVSYVETEDMGYEIEGIMPVATDDSVPVSEQVDTTLSQMMPELEYRYEGAELVEDYIVETYREYEVYRDEEGNVIEEIPTENFEFLRYQK